MKKTIQILAVSSMMLSVCIFSFNGSEYPQTISFRVVDANNIKTYNRNNGSFDREPNTGTAGFEWPKGTGKTAVYASGIWLSAKIHDSIRIAEADYGSNLRPGYFDYNTQQAYGENDPLYRIYKVSPDFPNGGNDFDSWNVWPVNQGAPWVDVNHNGTYEPPSDYPLMKGSQNFFYSATDGYPDTSSNAQPPMRAEIHFYAWAKTNSPCADAIHYEWKIINKNISAWTEMSAAIWSDIDIGTSNNDLVGTDSTLNLVFGYNGTPTDPIYGNNPPAIGYIIQNATGHAGNAKADFAQRWRCPFDCPDSTLEIFRVLHGLRADGTSWINPYSSNTPTKFPFSGNPESHSGWLDSMPGERYLIIGSIFGNVLPLDTIEFNTISFIKSGSNNLNSVTEIKNCVASVIGISSISNSVPENFVLYQNYPNPFNPETKIRFDVIGNGRNAATKVQLKIYNSLGREMSTLVDDELHPGSYEVRFNALQNGQNGDLPSGVYFYKLISGNYSDSKKMLLLK